MKRTPTILINEFKLVNTYDGCVEKTMSFTAEWFFIDLPLTIVKDVIELQKI